MITYNDHYVWVDTTGTRFRNKDATLHATVICDLTNTQDVVTYDGEEVRWSYGFRSVQEALAAAEKFVTTGVRPDSQQISKSSCHTPTKIVRFS